MTNWGVGGPSLFLAPSGLTSHVCPVFKPSTIAVKETELFLLPVHNRVPLKFGAQVVTGAVCARVRVRVEDRQGRSAEGWGETPLSVAWVWPSALTWDEREQRMIDF